MKKLTALLFCCFSFTIYAQVYISGVVYDIDNNPLEGASVYINNTSLGTTTNDKGEFSLNLPKGIYQLVVSYIGYNPEKYTLNTVTHTEPIQFKLIEKDNMLDEVVIKKKIPLAKNSFYFRLFKKHFIGQSRFARNCKISNKNVLYYYFDTTDNVLVVSASEPVIIVNKALGYRIAYDLIEFELTPSRIKYSGYVKFSELDGSNRNKEKWFGNRIQSYNGSKMHFLRSVLNAKVEQEGYIVDYFSRRVNPNRPSDEKIAAAKEIWNNKNSLQRNTDTSVNDILEAKEVIDQGNRLPKYLDEIIKNNIKPQEYIVSQNSKFELKFSGFIRVTYQKQSLDRGFGHRTSSIFLYNQQAEIHPMGAFNDPLEVSLEGYWTSEKVGDLLPLDYNPKK